MKSSFFATILNGILPGAGLLYLGHPWRAAANFVVACAITAIGVYSAEERVHYVFLAVMAGSAGYAHAICRSDRASAG